MKDSISNDYGHCYYCVCVNENCAFIYNLYVNKEHRRKGHAKQFIQQAINKIREIGYEKDIEIIAEPEEESITKDDLIKFYEKMNLKVID